MTETLNGGATSLLGSALGSVAAVRRQQRPGTVAVRRFFGALAELLGTIVALSCLSVAAFVAAGFAVGMVVVGVSVLLLDFQAGNQRRVRALRRGSR